MIGLRPGAGPDFASYHPIAQPGYQYPASTPIDIGGKRLQVPRSLVPNKPPSFAEHMKKAEARASKHMSKQIAAEQKRLDDLKSMLKGRRGRKEPETGLGRAWHTIRDQLTRYSEITRGIPFGSSYAAHQQAREDAPLLEVIKGMSAGARGGGGAQADLEEQYFDMRKTFAEGSKASAGAALDTERAEQTRLHNHPLAIAAVGMDGLIKAMKGGDTKTAKKILERMEKITHQYGKYGVNLGPMLRSTDALGALLNRQVGGGGQGGFNLKPQK